MKTHYEKHIRQLFPLRQVPKRWQLWVCKNASWRIWRLRNKSHFKKGWNSWTSDHNIKACKLGK